MSSKSDYEDHRACFKALDTRNLGLPWEMHICHIIHSYRQARLAEMDGKKLKYFQKQWCDNQGKVIVPDIATASDAYHQLLDDIFKVRSWEAWYSQSYELATEAEIELITQLRKDEYKRLK